MVALQLSLHLTAHSKAKLRQKHSDRHWVIRFIYFDRQILRNKVIQPVDTRHIISKFWKGQTPKIVSSAEHCSSILRDS